MSPREYKCLKKYKENYISRDCLDATDYWLIRNKWIAGTNCVVDNIGQRIPTAYTITESGLIALSEYEDAKKQQRTQNKIGWLQVFVPTATFFLGLFVEHFTGIVGFFFHQIP